MSTSTATPATASIPPGSMSLRGHLTELRNRILRSLGWLVLGGVLALSQWQLLFEWLQAPFIAAQAALPEGMAEIVTRQAQGGLVQVFRVATAGAVVLASPFLVLEAWGFIAPGLTATERRFAGSILPAVMLLFFGGCAFAYYVLFPPMVRFMLTFNAQVVTMQVIDIAEYLALITNLMIALGVAFQIPVVTFVLARIGLITNRTLIGFRRHAIVGAAVLAAIITPTPDAFNMTLLALPLYLLFEISVLVAWLSQQRPMRT